MTFEQNLTHRLGTHLLGTHNEQNSLSLYFLYFSEGRQAIIIKNNVIYQVMETSRVGDNQKGASF